MAGKTRFPDQISTVGGALVAFGVVQVVFFCVVWTKAEFAAEKVPGGNLSLPIHVFLALGIVIAGLGLVGKRRWAWWAALVLLPLVALASGIEIASHSAEDLQTATSMPEGLAATVVVLGALALAIALIWMRPRAIAPIKKAVGDVEHVDPRALAAMEATRRMSSRKTEDWGHEGDDEELLESMVWMTQMRQKDISGKREVEEAARKDEIDKRIERLPVVIDASPMAIAVCDKLGNVTLWNAAAQRLLGSSQAEVLGKPLPLGELDGGTDPSDLLARAASDGAVMGVGSTQTTKTGSVIPVSMSISTLPDIAGGVGGFMLVMADLSSKRTDGADQSPSTSAGLTDQEWASSAHGQHARRVTTIAELVARELGFSEQDATQIGRASMPHDIGKVGVSGEVWSKKGRLTDEEFDEVKTHTKIGGDMLTSTQTPLLKMAADIAYSHHERWDGYGYLGLRGEEIPIGARIVAVADAFDAITHDRPYRAASSIEHAAAELRKESGNQFDPRVVTAFLKLLDEGRLQVVFADA